ncbi:DsbA family oxidoreductase [Collimonas sp. OK607]|uniref:DsbA family oxidoreductase n=1 Tax=Collimonas sp. OK607 TaxID=1798194 RepID=UPI000B8102B2|nr:DsbA family oxidoreductase [Collimonas sp. OK607]
MLTMTNLQIEVGFDLICPWCLIGKVSLDKAISRFTEQYPSVEVNVKWHGVQLLPDVPKNGLPFQAFYEKRLGSLQAMSLRQQQVNDAAAKVGFRINFDRIKTFPNTAKAHALLTCMSNFIGEEEYKKTLDRLFHGYFFFGEDIGSDELLYSVAQAAGIGKKMFDEWLEQPESNILTDGYLTQIRGVPHYVFNQKTEISGAQSPEQIFAVMQNLLRS